MWVGRLTDGETVTLPDAPYVHVFAARGRVQFGETTLDEGDAARLTNAGPLELTAVGDAEVIVWESDQAARR
jgi:redox-sensitive bicupin YhaK (pirin superfamily)